MHISLHVPWWTIPGSIMMVGVGYFFYSINSSHYRHMRGLDGILAIVASTLVAAGIILGKNM